MEPSTAIFLLWVGFFLLLCALRKGLDNVEASLELETQRATHVRNQAFTHEFPEPDALGDVIGQFMDNPIYLKITVGGVDYHFDRILAPENTTATLLPSECCLGPGIVYAIGAPS